MKIEKRKEEEIAKRQGQTEITIIMFVWLVMSFLVAFFGMRQLFNAGIITEKQIYDAGIPENIPIIVIQFLMALLVFIFIQTFLYIGYAMASGPGRRTPGQASLHSNYERDHH